MSDQKPVSENRKKVIVVDDDENTRRQLKRYLERLDCEVTSYSDVEAVKNYISENVNNILAVFLDLVIGNSDINSFKLLEDISTVHPDLPVFAYSAYDPEEKAAEAIKRGAYWYIDKHNAKGTEFLSAVQSALRTWQLTGKVTDLRKFAEFRQHLIDAIPYEIMVRDKNYNIILENMTKKKRFDCDPSEKSVVPVENEDVKTGLGMCNLRYENGTEECKKDCSCDRALKTGKPQQSDHPWKRQMLHIVAAPISGEDNLVVETAADVSIQYSVRSLMQEIVRNAANGRDEIIATTLQRLAPADDDKETIKTGFKRAFAFLFNPPGNNKKFILQGCSESTPQFNIEKQIFSLDENPVYESILANDYDKSNSIDSYVIDEKMYRTGVSETIMRFIGDPKFQIIIPICSSNHTDGFILVDKGLDNAEGNEFTWDEKHWCKVLSEFLSGIFITIRQYEGHKWLIETQQELAKARKKVDIFDNLIAQIKTHFKADRVDVYDVNWDIEKIKLWIGHAHHPDCGMFKDGFSTQIGINGRACKNQEAEFVPDCRNDNDFKEFNSQKELFGPCQLHNEDKQPCAVAIVPFTNSERVVGSMCIAFGYERVFDKIDKDLLRNLGASLSLVFSAVEVAEQEQRRSSRRLGRNLAALFNAVENAGDEDKIIRYCLTYITAGCGLGYNRAIFYRMIDKKNESNMEFELQYAIGQLNLDEWNDLFASTNKKFEEKPFKKMLSDSIDNQPSNYFSLLKKKFNTIASDCTLYKSMFVREARIIEIPTSRDDRHWNDYTYNLMMDTGSKSILVIGVYLDDKNDIPFGAFIVDSAFIGNLGDERNKADLNLFAAAVGHIFNEFYKQQQYEKNKTETLLGTITKYIGHDIKQPLTAMKPEIDTIKDFFSGANNPEFINKCSVIESKIDRVMEMIDRISRFYSDVYMDYDVLDVVNDSYEIVKEFARKKLISMEIDPNGISKETLMAKGKAGILLQGLSNILTNAIAAIECKYKNDETTNGTIKITVRKDAGTAIVEITDNGIGMDDEQVKKIQNGQEIDSSKDDAGTGAGPRTGIGLSIFRESLDQNNAKFKVKSNPQKGTTFKIILKLI